MATYDLIIRGGLVVDGTGAGPRPADVAVSDGTIVEVGEVDGSCTREVAADGAIVTPGWVDAHTHYDGQASWTGQLQPSSLHGVTTVVSGNCGVGFAPARSDDHDRLIELMEGIEDIPGTALYEGLTWDWEHFTDYMDALSRRSYDIDLGVYVPHDPLRIFVMGDRGAEREDATPEDIAEMARLVREGIERGALGFSTDRNAFHRASTGDQAPSYQAASRECIGIAVEAGKARRGAIQLISDFDDMDEEWAMLETMVTSSGMPMSFTLLSRAAEDARRDALLARIEDANARGLPIYGQIPARPIGLLLGLQCSLNPFSLNAVFREKVSHLTVAAQAKALQDPDLRAAILAEPPVGADKRIPFSGFVNNWADMFELTDPPNYIPDVADSFAARAQREGRSPAEIAYDLLSKDDGKGLIYMPLTFYHNGESELLSQLVSHPYTIQGLSDGGAHVGAICDASFPTTLLQYWGRDRSAGRFDLGFLVEQQTSRVAKLVGIEDRGVIAPGYRADLNVIDFDNLRLRRPEVHYDLPAGGRRLLQRAEGYLHTFVRGTETYHNGEPTGEMPGRFLRSAPRSNA